MAGCSKLCLAGVGRVFIGPGLIFNTLRTYSPEYKVIPEELETMGILYGSFQIWDQVHVNIIYAAAQQAPDVIMLGSYVIEPVCAAGDLAFAYIAVLGQLLKIPVHSSAADTGMFAGYFFVDLVRCRVVMETLNSFQCQSSLYSIAFYHLLGPDLSQVL